MDLEQSRYTVRAKTHHHSGESFKYLFKGKKKLIDQLNEETSKSKLGAVYVHIPYCSNICSFCNMRRSLRVPHKEYADLVVKQIENYAKFKYIKDSSYDSIYFGGGTPTTLKKEELRKILRALKYNLNLTKDCEISVETSISDLDEEKMKMLYEEGVNRFSIGVQTFSERGRKVLGRKSSKEQVIQTIRKLKETGFNNISIDMIYNYPEQTLDEVKEDIQCFKDLDVAGFSFYSLIINEKSKLAKDITSSEVFYEENFQREKDFFKTITESTLKDGFEFLELTKIVKPGRDKYKYIVRRHQGEDTLPLGAGAGGKLGNIPVMNPIDIEEYKNQIDTIDKLEYSEMNGNYNTLNKITGQIQQGQIDTSLLRSNDKIDSFISEMIEEGFVIDLNGKYTLTTKGVFWGNNIAREFSDLVVNKFKNL